MRYTVYGLVLLTLIGAFGTLCALQYAQAFTPTTTVALRADRSGLQMYPGNRVQLRGVDVGRVGSVELADGGEVLIELEMDPELLGQIPANVGVSLDQLTAFGAKTVHLTDPERPSTASLAAGGELSAQRVTVEPSRLFDELDRVLAAARPAQVNAVLGSLADALDGRGDDIGETTSQLAAYLRKFNADLPALRRALDGTAEVSDLYADVTPDLGRLLDNAAFTSTTVVEQQAELESFLFQITRVSGIGSTFVDRNGDRLVEVLDDAIPTTELLEEYSPGLTCFLQGLDNANRRLSVAIGGTFPGVHGNTTFEPGDQPYRNPDDLPVVGADNGPDCTALPDSDGNIPPDVLLKDVDRGGEPNPDGDNRIRPGDPLIVAELFGPLAATPLPEAGG